MTRQQLISEIRKKRSFLCIGLDSDITKIPKHLLKYSDPLFEFNKQIIEATKDIAVAYKPNLAFYECMGTRGWISLEKTLKLISDNIFTIADAKRGDIGNTSALYAKTFFETMYFNAVTVAPYMGSDSVLPFLTYKNKWVILLSLTSNEGAKDFQMQRMGRKYLFEKVLETSKKWGTPDNMMYVVGATKALMLKKVREIVPDNFLLIPGVGAQGGNLQNVCKYGLNKDCGLLVNSSRNIIYAGTEKNFAEKAREEAMKIKKDMEKYCRNSLFSILSA